MNFKFPVSCFHFIILKMSLVSSLKCFYCSFSPDVVDCHQLCFKAIPQQPFMPCCIHHVSSSFSVNCQKHWKLNCQDLRWMKRALTGRNDVSHMKKKKIHSQFLGNLEAIWANTRMWFSENSMQQGHTKTKNPLVSSSNKQKSLSLLSISVIMVTKMANKWWPAVFQTSLLWLFPHSKVKYRLLLRICLICWDSSAM